MLRMMISYIDNWYPKLEPMELDQLMEKIGKQSMLEPVDQPILNREPAEKTPTMRTMKELIEVPVRNLPALVDCKLLPLPRYLRPQFISSAAREKSILLTPSLFPNEVQSQNENKPLFLHAAYST
ncbi:hypothetical protein Ciccas_009293, partial [Cichlidogyrus casuarinus]